MTIVHFIKRLPGGSTYRLGSACQHEKGWRFISNHQGHRSSRKFHPTMEACVPRWAANADREEVVR